MGEIAAIVAMDESRLIGASGALPWHLPVDLKHFSALTTGHTVIMGSATWKSLPAKYRPLPKRKNIVVSRNERFRAEQQVPAEVALIPDPVSFGRDWLNESAADATLWVIGGAQLYAAMLPLCSRVELTLVSGTHAGDTYLAHFEDDFVLTREELADGCRFMSYVRAP